MGKLVSNSSGGNLHYKESSEILANGRFQTPAERIYTITNDDLLEEVSQFQTPAEEIYTTRKAARMILS